MALANQEAQRFNHEYIGTEHILLGLVKEGSGVGANVLKNLGVDLNKVRQEVSKLVKSGPDMVATGKLPQTPRAKKVIEYSIEEARSLNHTYIGTEHLLLGILREQDGVAAQVLMNLGLNIDDVREEVLNLLIAAEGDQTKESVETERQLQKTCVNLRHEIQRLLERIDIAVAYCEYERAVEVRKTVEGARQDMTEALEQLRQILARLRSVG